MRKLILRWLLGSDAIRWQDMFRIACECHQTSGKMLENCKYLLDQYKDISSKLIAVLTALQEENDLYYLRRKVLEIMTSKGEEVQDEGGTS